MINTLLYRITVDERTIHIGTGTSQLRVLYREKRLTDQGGSHSAPLQIFAVIRQIRTDLNGVLGLHELLCISFDCRTFYNFYARSSPSRLRTVPCHLPPF